MARSRTVAVLDLAKVLELRVALDRELALRVVEPFVHDLAVGVNVPVIELRVPAALGPPAERARSAASAAGDPRVATRRGCGRGVQAGLRYF